MTDKKDYIQVKIKESVMNKIENMVCKVSPKGMYHITVKKKKNDDYIVSLCSLQKCKDLPRPCTWY